jgi:hypothetical protein
MVYSDTSSDPWIDFYRPEPAEPEKPMSQELYDWYQRNVSPIGDQFTGYLTRSAEALARIPQDVSKGLEYVGQNVARPALEGMQQLRATDWSNQPFIGIGEQGEFTGRLPALAGYVTPYLLGAAPGGSATLPAGLKLPGKTYGYPEGLEGGYHGTHTVFGAEPENVLGKFSNQFINTGEGAQAYGYGHYIGGKKGTGVNYMPSAEDTSLHIGGMPWDPFKPSTTSSGEPTWRLHEQTAHDLIMDAPRIATPSGRKPDMDAVVEKLRGQISEIESEIATKGNTYGNMPQYMHDLEYDRKTLDFIESNRDKFSYETPGSLYHVEMKPSEESLMHWDKKLGEQSPEVLDKLQQVAEKHFGIGTRIPWDTYKDMTAGEFYNSFKHDPALQKAYPGMTGNGQAMSEAMREAGIPGIRYTDQQSRPINDMKELMKVHQDNIDKYQKVLDQDLVPGGKAYQDLLARDAGSTEGINDIRNIVAKEVASQQANLEPYKNRLRMLSTLVFDGKPAKTYEELAKNGDKSAVSRTALHNLWEAKDVDGAIARLKAEEKNIMEAARLPNLAQNAPWVPGIGNPLVNSPSRIINRKAVEWLEKNRDRVSLKEPDVTHNYVIFDPKELNIIHREKNIPKGGYI